MSICNQNEIIYKEFYSTAIILCLKSVVYATFAAHFSLGEHLHIWLVAPVLGSAKLECGTLRLRYEHNASFSIDSLCDIVVILFSETITLGIGSDSRSIEKN